jgi:hypothetical protein
MSLKENISPALQLRGGDMTVNKQKVLCVLYL